MPPTITVVPIQLPGRESRISEEPERELNRLIDRLLVGLQPYWERPFALFGHSMGALVAFELAKRVEKTANYLPKYLIVSGINAPHLLHKRAPLHHLPDDQFLDEIKDLNGTSSAVLSDSELQALILPTLRADFELCDTYLFEESDPLVCPIAAFNGLGDRHTSREETEAWRKHTASHFSIRMFPGDHFYLAQNKGLFLKMIAKELQTAL